MVVVVGGNLSQETKIKLVLERVKLMELLVKLPRVLLHKLRQIGLL